MKWHLSSHVCVVSTYLSFLLIEIVDNDADEEIEGEEGAKNDEDDKVQVHVEVDFSNGLFLHLQSHSFVSLLVYLSHLHNKKWAWSQKDTLTPLESTAACMISIHPLNVAYHKI